MIFYRTLDLNNQTIYYKIQTIKNTKKISLKIDRKGTIKLIIPHNYPLEEGINFLNQKKDWIISILNDLEKRNSNYYFLGSLIKLNKIQLNGAKKFNFLFEDTKNLLTITGNFNHDVSDQQLYITWLKIAAENYIFLRVRELAQKFNFHYRKIGFRDNSTRFGSCSIKNNLTFNIHLMKFRKEIIDYVIIHELCHTIEHNHSNKFWNLVRKYDPLYLQHLNELKRKT